MQNTGCQPDYPACDGIRSLFWKSLFLRLEEVFVKSLFPFSDIFPLSYEEHQNILKIMIIYFEKKN